MNKIRLLLADDHPLIREGFRALLGQNTDFEIVGEARDGKELVQVASSASPDIILVDITMPGLSGLDAMEQVKKENPQIRYIVLTMHEEREYVMNAIRGGADGYLLKNVERMELEKAVKTVYGGGKYFSPFVINILTDSVLKPDGSDQSEITPREKEVLEMVGKGLSTKQIADRMGISVRTVESHRINMLKKFKVNNTAELIKKAIELNILK